MNRVLVSQERQALVLDVIRTQPGCNTREIADAIGWPTTKEARTTADALYTKRIVNRVGSTIHGLGVRYYAEWRAS